MAQRTYRIRGMDCADCALKVEKGVRQLAEVDSAHVDFATAMLHVEGGADESAIQRRVAALGYALEEPATRRQAVNRPGSVSGFLRFLIAQTETRLALIGGGLLLLSVFFGLIGISENLARLTQVAALLVAGYPIARSGLANLWINRDFNINLLMTIAAVGAVIIGETAESATLIFLFAISEALEGYTADRARRALDSLSELVPATAIRLIGEVEAAVPVEELRVGDMVVVRAGERVPVDGVVSSGQSAVNQAPVTGESVLVDKQPGAEVFAGTVNGSGTLIVQVSRLVQDTTLQRIIRMIEEAQAVRAPTQRFIDRFARVYTPLMVVVAVLVAGVPPLLFGQPFFNPPGDTGWLYRALALLVIACPCALVISAPVTVVSAITAAARRGVLFKGGAYLEALAETRVFAFDKTGTLTEGRPAVTGFRSVDCHNGLECSDCDDVLAIASALERRSSHPIARSVVLAAEERGLDARYPAAGEIIALAGSGVQGQIDGRLAIVGSHPFFDREHPHEEMLCAWVKDAEGQGNTTMLVSDGKRVRGFISVADTVRPDSQAVVSGLKQMGYQTAMLTGDNAGVANSVGAQLNIDHIYAGLLPEGKVAALSSLRERYGSIAMVGDGINDAPALASAGLGIAMGGAGSAQAMETADIVLMAGDLRQLPFAVRLSGFTRRLIRANVVISLATKLVFVLLALGGLTSLWLAVLADVGVSLLVTGNGLRAGRFENNQKN